MTRAVFMTGATGYVGSGLLQKWLDASDAKINLLARGRREQRPADRMRAVLAELYPGGDVSAKAARLEVWEGDVSRERLGLDAADYARLAATTSHVVHCAAAARFDLDIEEARRTNVTGTENVLDFAAACKGLTKVDYIGTAYVAGERKGVVKEEELDVGQRHRNTYERSKFEAEKVVRARSADLPITVLRPSVVTCDSRTGRASNHNGFYRLLKAYYAGGLKMLPGNPSSFLDLVPGDYVAEAVYAISHDEQSGGKCYHLTAGLGRATTLGEIRELAGRYLGEEDFTLVPPADFERYVSSVRDALSEEERGALEELTLYIPYLTAEMEFDNSHAKAVSGTTAPPLSSYFEKMATYIKEQSR